MNIKLANIAAEEAGKFYHFNTLIINVIGSFVLMLFLTIAFELMKLNADLR